MVALHGCNQGYGAVGTAFVDKANLNQYADTNNMIVLYPQAIASGANPNGCWDWWGTSATATTRSTAVSSWRPS